MKKSLLATLVATVLTTGPVHAANYPAGTVTLNGLVSDTTCNVFANSNNISTSGSNTTVIFAPLAASAFGGINQGPQQNIDLGFSDCPESITSLNLMFAGTADADNPEAFANSAGSGSATGVAVVLQRGYPAPTVFVPNQTATNSPVAIDASRQGGLALSAQLIQTTVTEPTSGPVIVYATVNMVY